jgi:2'-5' RNA ligase
MKVDKKILAVDIVLLPRGEFKQLLKKQNSLLTRQDINFKDDKMLPHLSILMACLDKNDIQSLNPALNKVISKYLPLKIEIEGLVVKKTDNDFATHLKIKKTDILIELQKELIEIVSKYKNHPAKKDYFFEPKEIGEFALNYTQNFLENSTNQNFKPHFTIGLGQPVKTSEFPASVEIEKLAIAQLGKYCTCRQIIT